MSSKSSNRLLKFTYYLGVFFGVFTFSYNSTTKSFEASKNLQIYKRILAVGVAISVFKLSFIEKTTVSLDNMVIQIATPLNFYLLVGIVLNTYIILSMKDQDIVKILNFGLDIKAVLINNDENFEFHSKLFMRTFAMDGFFLFFVCLIFFRVYNLIDTSNAFYMLVFLQCGKNLNRFMTHLYICGIEYCRRLMSKLEDKVKALTEKFKSFQEANPVHTRYQLLKRCCILSDDLDYYAIQAKKIMDLIDAFHGLFSCHICLMIIYNMTDVLVLVSKTFC